MRIPWRFQTDHDGQFDELVLGKDCFVHLEMMERNMLALFIGDPKSEGYDRWAFFITFGRDGNIKRVTLSETPQKVEAEG